ncbi:hypothetical protein [Cryptosporangium sp. NPDC051539]|uniref:hypothetical protein n=1 Tax=Cryptosporangium sp. NPDC051539 TaxID=3363962 RepID=UPI00379D48FF
MRGKRLALSAAVAAGYVAGRRRMVRWGATADEVSGLFPGAEVILGATRSATMAVTLEALPAQIWPWLVQMGADRGGWYSWDRLDNFGRRSTDQIHPEWQEIQVGDRLWAKPDGSQWWTVAVVDPERFLGLRMSLDLAGRPFDPTGERPAAFTDSTWGFRLTELPGERTRLVVSGYWEFRPAWLRPFLSLLVLEPAHWIMQTRQFHNLRRRVEQPPSQAVIASVGGGEQPAAGSTRRPSRS